MKSNIKKSIELTIYIIILFFGIITNLLKDHFTLDKFYFNPFHYESKWLIIFPIVLSSLIPILNKNWRNELIFIPIIIGAYIFSGTTQLYFFLRDLFIYFEFNFISLSFFLIFIILLYNIYKVRFWGILLYLILIITTLVVGSFYLNFNNLLTDFSFLIPLFLIVYFGYILIRWTKINKLKQVKA